MYTVLRFLLIAALIWLIPFLISIPFFDRTGRLIANFWVFKAVMIAALGLSAFYLFSWFYRRTSARPQPWTRYALLGLGALAINVALDSVTIIPLTGITPGQYLSQVAALYLLIVAISVYVGTRRSAYRSSYGIEA